MRISPFNLELSTPVQAPPSPRGRQYEAVTPRALTVAKDIAAYMDMQRMVEVSFAIAGLPAPEERMSIYMTRGGEEIHPDALLREPRIGEVTGELPPPIVQASMRGVGVHEDPTAEEAPIHFDVWYALYRLGTDSNLLRCSLGTWGGSFNADTQRIKENTLADLFPGQYATQVADLEYINLGMVNRQMDWQHLRPFNQQAFGCDILKLMSCGLLHVSDQPLAIRIADGTLTES